MFCPGRQLGDGAPLAYGCFCSGKAAESMGAAAGAVGGSDAIKIKAIPKAVTVIAVFTFSSRHRTAVIAGAGSYALPFLWIGVPCAKWPDIDEVLIACCNWGQQS